MKIKFAYLITVLISLCIVHKSFSQNIGINGTGGNAHASALLDVDAVATPSLGILIPRIALQAINVASPVTSPATSLLVYNTAVASSGTNAVSAGYYYWDGTQWVRFAYNPSGISTSAWNLIGNAGTTAGTNFLGTTDAQDVVFKTNALEAVRINTLGNVGVNNTNPTSAKLIVNSSNSAHDVITALHTSGSTTAAFHAVKGSVVNASYTTAVGYLAYHNTANATYGLYGTGGSFGAVILNKTYIGNLQPAPINVGDLEVSNVIGGTNPANFTLRQSTSITTAASDMGYLNFSDNAISGAQAAIRANREQASSGITDLPTALTFHTMLDGTATLSEQMRISNNGFVGIGTSIPTQKLHVSQGNIKSTNNGFSLHEAYSYGAGGHPVFIGYAGGGTESVPTYPSAGATLSSFIGRDVIDGNSANYGGASIYMLANENYSAANKGSIMQFSTTKNGTNFPGERMRIDDKGYVGIGTTLPLAKLHVFGGNAVIADNAQSNFNVSRTSQILYVDNIKGWSDNGLRIYDGNSNGYIDINNASDTYIQSHNTAGALPNVLNESGAATDASYSNIYLNSLGGNEVLV